MIANILIGLSAAIALLAFADLLLDEQQKKSISNGTLQLWIWLDRAKSLSLPSWIRRPGVIRTFCFLGQMLCVAIVAVNAYLYTQYMSYIRHWGLWKFGVMLGLAMMPGALLSLWVGPKIIRWILEFRTPLRLIGYMVVVVFVVSWIDPILYGLLRIFFSDPFRALTSAPQELLFIFNLGLGFIAAFALLLGLTMLLPITLAYLTTVVLYVGEFVVRRIAENPKGPILAISGLVGALAALVKAIV